MAILFVPGRLENLLPLKIKRLEVILTRDDPLNSPAELLSLQNSVSETLLTVLPRGGHLGYLLERRPGPH